MRGAAGGALEPWSATPAPSRRRWTGPVSRSGTTSCCRRCRAWSRSCPGARPGPRRAAGRGGAVPPELTRPSARSSFQQRLSYTTLSDLALALLDGTVFEIVQGLLEIQHLTEKSLYNQRLRLQNEHRGARGRGEDARSSCGRAACAGSSVQTEPLPGGRSKEVATADQLEASAFSVTSESSQFYFLSCNIPL